MHHPQAVEYTYVVKLFTQVPNKRTTKTTKGKSLSPDAGSLRLCLYAARA